MRRVLPLIAIAALCLASIPIALRVEVDPGTHGWVDAHGAAALAQAAEEARFGRQDGFLIAMVGPDVLSPAATAWQREIAGKLAIMSGVAAVEGLSTAQDVVVDELGPAPVPLLDQPRQQILSHPIYRGLLVSGDGEATGIFARLRDDVDDRQSIRLEADIRALLEGHPAPSGYAAFLGGLPIQQHAIARAVAKDQSSTVPLTILMLSLVLAVTIPSPGLIAATLAGVGSALSWTFAGLVLAGQQLDSLLGLLPPLVLGIGVATAFHLIRALARAQLAGEARPRMAALKRLLLPGSLATLTALAGVGGLWLGAVPAVREFAPWAMVGVAVGTVMPVAWICALFPLIRPRSWSRVAEGTTGRRFGDWLGARSEAIARRAMPILVATAAVAAMAIVWCSRLRSDADFVHALPAADPARVAQEEIDARLTGSLSLDVLVDAGHAPTSQEIARLAAIEQVALQDPTVKHAMSLVDIIELLRQRGDERPPAAIIDDLRLGAKSTIGRFLGPSLGSGSADTTLRLCIRQSDGSVAAAAATARRIGEAASQAFPGARVSVASAALLLDETTNRLLPATAKSLLASKIAVVLLLFVFLRRWRLALIALVLAALPLLITYAVIPALGWPLDIGVSMIACIALGIIMNDTVHLVDAIHRHGLSQAYREVGPAVVPAAVALAVAFSACDVGSFSYTRRFGALLALAFIVGLAVNLLLAPALYRILRPTSETKP